MFSLFLLAPNESTDNRITLQQQAGHANSYCFLLFAIALTLR